MIESTNQFIYLVAVTACLLMGVAFFAFPTPKVAMLRHYKFSKKILGLSYLTLGGLMLLNILLGSPHKPMQFLAFQSIIISSTQACLFTFTLLTLANPNLSTPRYIWKQLSPILLFIFLFVISNAIWGDPATRSIKSFFMQMNHPTVVIRFLFFSFYIFQLFYYTRLFLLEKKAFRNKMYDYYSDDALLKMRWVEYAFYAALGIGILAFCSYFFPSILFDNIFVAFYTIFYILFAFGYLHYDLFYEKVEKIVEEIATISIPTQEKTNDILLERQDLLEQKFSILMQKKKAYLRKGLTSEEVATELRTNRKYLSEVINKRYGVNFNTYINRLRVQDAYILLKEHPELSTAELAEQVGFSDVSHFCRQFKAIAGCTSGEWKEKEKRKTTLQ